MLMQQRPDGVGRLAHDYARRMVSAPAYRVHGLSMGPEWTPATGASHEMVCEAETAAEVLFVCAEESCGRRVVVGKSRPRLTVIDRGDFTVRHAGSLGAVAIDDVAAA